VILVGVFWLLFSLPALTFSVMLAPAVDQGARHGAALTLALVLTPFIAMGGAVCCFLGGARRSRALATWGCCAPLAPIALLIAIIALR
jgi:hypothetical protein